MKESSPTGPKFTFTDRRREVLNLLANGYDRNEAADQLDISLGTVKRHIEDLTAAFFHHHSEGIDFPIHQVIAFGVEQGWVTFENGCGITIKPLSPRQEDVVEQMSHGYTNAKVAERLGIAERTVKVNKERIFTKLHARNQAHAVAIVTGIREALKRFF